MSSPPERGPGLAQCSILHVIPTLQVGGAERLLVDVTRHQVADGHCVSVVVTSGGGPLLDQVDPRVRLEVWDHRGALYDFRLMRRFSHFVRSDRPGIVHGWLLQPNVMVGLAAWRYGLAGVTSEHSLLAPKSRIHHRMRAAVHAISPLPIICVSSAVAREVQRTYRAAPDDIVVVPNGVSPSKVKALYQEASPLFDKPSDNTLVVGTLARLESRKGISDLLEAASLLQREHSVPVVCVVAGRVTVDTSVDELRRQAARRGLQLLHFSQVEPARLFRSIDVYVQPSHAEGFGLAALEAMASGVPTIASEIAGLRELVPAEGLTPPGQPAKMADLIWSLARDDRVLAEHGERCRLAAMQFDVQRTVSGYSKVYGLARRRRPA